MRSDSDGKCGIENPQPFLGFRVSVLGGNVASYNSRLGTDAIGWYAGRECLQCILWGALVTRRPLPEF